VIDLATIPEAPKKIEGAAVADPHTVVVINDNDFGMTDGPGAFDANGRLVDSGVATRVVVIRLDGVLHRESTGRGPQHSTTGLARQANGNDLASRPAGPSALVTLRYGSRAAVAAPRTDSSGPATVCVAARSPIFRRLATMTVRSSLRRSGGDASTAESRRRR
jgi:hypothetical protein